MLNQLHFVETRGIEISATDIRNRVHDRFTNLLPRTGKSFRIY